MAKVTATLRPAVAVHNAERSRTSFYMSKVSGSCQRLVYGLLTKMTNDKGLL